MIIFFTVGKCAYFNTYGSGNVDERECKPGNNMTCSQSKHQFGSNKNTQCELIMTFMNIVFWVFILSINILITYYIAK